MTDEQFNQLKEMIYFQTHAIYSGLCMAASERPENKLNALRNVEKTLEIMDGLRTKSTEDEEK